MPLRRDRFQASGKCVPVPTSQRIVLPPDGSSGCAAPRALPDVLGRVLADYRLIQVEWARIGRNLAPLLPAAGVAYLSHQMKNCTGAFRAG